MANGWASLTVVTLNKASVSSLARSQIHTVIIIANLLWIEETGHMVNTDYQKEKVRSEVTCTHTSWQEPRGTIPYSPGYRGHRPRRKRQGRAGGKWGWGGQKCEGKERENEEVGVCKEEDKDAEGQDEKEKG